MWELNYLPSENYLKFANQENTYIYIKKLFHTTMEVCHGFKPHKFGTFNLSNHIEFHHNYLKPDLAGTHGLQTMKICTLSHDLQAMKTCTFMPCVQLYAQ
jgi:hypothetical protein